MIFMDISVFECANIYNFFSINRDVKKYIFRKVGVRILKISLECSKV